MLFIQGFNCDVTVDDVTIVSMLPYEYYQRHLAYVTTVKLDSSRQWKWCPNVKCGRAGNITFHHGMTCTNYILGYCPAQFLEHCLYLLIINILFILLVILVT
jgi:hypothetical protein